MKVVGLMSGTSVDGIDAIGSHRSLPHMPDQVILGGGGALNPTLIDMLQHRLGAIQVIRHEDLSLLSDAKEVIAFVVLAYETVHGRPGNLPACTGAKSQVMLGQIMPGSNFSTVLSSTLPRSGSETWATHPAETRLPP